MRTGNTAMTTPMSLLSLSGLSLSWLSIYIHDPVLLGAAALAWRLLQYCLVAWCGCLDVVKWSGGGVVPALPSPSGQAGRRPPAGAWREAAK
ncbi:Os08g0361501 [Oryza sativa Japonica Group]|uniref:Os08g0361501 protein n=1 Tax=Oryza sativa subsp. japonica TaxID=39947 RepID=A0A0P0XEZ5_ORYSJ|nr:Os08g0361501 [Oryza sativa Japonica Group]